MLERVARVAPTGTPVLLLGETGTGKEMVARMVHEGSRRAAAPLRADFRLVAATHRDLKRMVQGGTFRSDLYYRISAYPVPVPTLRERREDILLLAEWLLMRELRNIVERATLLADGDRIDAHHLPEKVTPGRSA